MKVFKKNGILVILAALLFCSGVFFGFNSDEKDFEIDKNLNIYQTLVKKLDMHYVDGIDSGDLIKKSMDAMLSSLDPYTVYIPESKMEDFNKFNTGKYGGMGSLITTHGDDVVILELFEGCPADKAGLRVGDIFVEINGVKIKKKGYNQVRELMKGLVNETKVIKVRRPGVNGLIDIKVVLDTIKMSPVPYYGMLEDSIGYVILNQFTNQAAGGIRTALREFKDKNAKSIILDLRGNPGGLLAHAVAIVTMFNEKGEDIVSVRGKYSERDQLIKVTREPMDTEIPIAILVDGRSASASECVTGAIQDLDRGIVVGQRSFGKGLVQSMLDLSYNSKLRVTTEKYYTPSGRCIQALDYSKRNADGSVGEVPDSLKSEFKTKNGRQVFDGGGILPDVKVDLDVFSSLSAGLISKHMIFDYATLYANKHSQIADANSFELSDKDYKDFKQFLKTEKFEYESESTEALEALKKVAKGEKYFSIAKKEFAKITEKLKPNLDRDLKMFEKEIKTLIANEIVKRYYYKAGGIQYSIRGDKVLKAAVSTLKDEKKYNTILNK